MEEKRILLVDDEEDFVETLAERLRLRGFDVEATASPEDAIREMERSLFDVVVLDLRMPKISGEDLSRWIRRRFPKTRLVFVTGHGSGLQEGQDMFAAAHCCLMKPFQIDALVEAMEHARPAGGEEADDDDGQ